MSEQLTGSFDYFRVTVDDEYCSQYMDGYQKFGWRMDENVKPEKIWEK